MQVSHDERSPIGASVFPTASQLLDFLPRSYKTSQKITRRLSSPVRRPYTTSKASPSLSLRNGKCNRSQSTVNDASTPPSVITIFPVAPASILDVDHGRHTYTTRVELSETKRIVFGCLTPILVIISGVFVGLALEHTSLDKTQLNLLSISGTS